MASKDKKEELHEEHKKRLRKKFFEDGDFSNFYEHEILEMLLNFVVVRKNTNEIAHRLLDRFATLESVFEAHPDELMKVKGVGERSATIIKMQYELFRAYSTSEYKMKNQPYSAELVIPYLKGMFFGKRKENFYMISVDSKGKIIKPKCIGDGISELQIDFRLILSELLAVNARGVLLAHNHPNGVLRASEEDIYTTKIMEETLKRVKIKLIDHLIFAGDDYISVLNTHSFKIKTIKP